MIEGVERGGLRGGPPPAWYPKRGRSIIGSRVPGPPGRRRYRRDLGREARSLAGRASAGPRHECLRRHGRHRAAAARPSCHLLDLRERRGPRPRAPAPRRPGYRRRTPPRPRHRRRPPRRKESAEPRARGQPISDSGSRPRTGARPFMHEGAPERVGAGHRLKKKRLPDAEGGRALFGRTLLRRRRGLPGGLRPPPPRDRPRPARVEREPQARPEQPPPQNNYLEAGGRDAREGPCSRARPPR